MEVATSEQVMYRCQGKLVLLRKILSLKETIRHNKEEKE
jgi:hypothetical protein